MRAISDHAFGREDPFSLGVEEELFIVDSVSGRMVNSSAAVTERLGSAMPGIERELHDGMVELITEVCSDTREALDQLAHRRAACVGTGVGLLGAGTHPTVLEGEPRISDKDRYERIRQLLGDVAVATPVAGVHVHVGMPDPKTAMRVFNGLRVRLPLLQALAANSPFLHGRDTGVASARDLAIRAWPRSGVPRAVESFEDFCATTELLTRAAEVEDYTWFWWKLRPHPKLGTVEIRAFDAQTSLRDTEALVAFTHCLARAAAEEDNRENPIMEVLEEGMFRAARFGVNAELPTAAGELRAFGDVLSETLDQIRPYARELNCEEGLAMIPALAAAGGGAGRQREIYELAGIEALLRELTRVTGQTANTA